MNLGQLPYAAEQVQNGIIGRIQDASRQADAAARSEAVAASTERSAILAEAFTKGVAKLRSFRSSRGSTSRASSNSERH